ncbi:hypothetical protein [Hydrogenoanaerobacterium sp.]|uniref:hypothetical protein n=1 Tax=Hydrogenoanaerobacterium sp. TaxID=2953763 RepID=UPI002899F9D0|nr:hypothetical protein [Hydrogenoanaerobacterium sp.]
MDQDDTLNQIVLNGLSILSNTFLQAQGDSLDTISLHCHCICKDIKESIYIKDLQCVVDSSISYDDIQRFVLDNRTIVRAGYNVAIKYSDKEGCEKKTYFSGSVLFVDLPEPFASCDFTVHLCNFKVENYCTKTTISALAKLYCNPEP